MSTDLLRLKCVESTYVVAQCIGIAEVKTMRYHILYSFIIHYIFINTIIAPGRCIKPDGHITPTLSSTSSVVGMEDIQEKIYCVPFTITYQSAICVTSCNQLIIPADGKPQISTFPVYMLGSPHSPIIYIRYYTATAITPNNVYILMHRNVCALSVTALNDSFN